MKETLMAASAERSGSSGTECSDCSHCAHPPNLRSRAGVRVSLNLEHFFSDQRAHAFMWAPYRRCVQWLTRRVARVFELPHDIVLMSRGHMLPVIEPLLMLNRDDPLDVVKRSYVLTPQDEKNKQNVRVCQSKAIVCQAQTIMTNQNNMGPLIVCNKTENIAENQITSKVSPMDNVKTKTELEKVDNLSEDSEELQQLKRKALRMLDEHCYMMDETCLPKRVRRRRRRRKPPGPLDDSMPQVLPTDSGESEIVLRNGLGSRPPRLVRALSPASVV